MLLSNKLHKVLNDRNSYPMIILEIYIACYSYTTQNVHVANEKSNSVVNSHIYLILQVGLRRNMTAE